MSQSIYGQLVLSWKLMELNTYKLFSHLIIKSFKLTLSTFEGCSFMLGRALTSVVWGIVADRYGRKPVILIGTASVLVIL